MAYTPYLNPLTVSLAGMTGSTWTTLSSGVPAGASGVKLLWEGVSSAGSSVRVVRAPSSTDSYIGTSCSAHIGSTPISQEWNIGVDSGGNFQYYSNSGTPTEGVMWVLGYFGTESVFLTNAVSLGSVGTSYGTISASTAIPAGGIAGFFFITGGDQGTFIRMNGSSDSLANANSTSQMNWLVGCDSSQNVSAIAISSGRVLYCQGYMTAGYVAHMNAVNVTPGTSGSFQNIAQAGGDSGVIANLYWYNTNAGATIQLGGQSASTFPAVHYPASIYSGQNSAYAPTKANLSTITTATLYELGYFIAAPITPPIRMVHMSNLCL